MHHEIDRHWLVALHKTLKLNLAQNPSNKDLFQAQTAFKIVLHKWGFVLLFNRIQCIPQHHIVMIPALDYLGKFIRR